jgi:hypothetical protein
MKAIALTFHAIRFPDTPDLGPVVFSPVGWTIAHLTLCSGQ